MRNLINVLLALGALIALGACTTVQRTDGSVTVLNDDLEAVSANSSARTMDGGPNLGILLIRDRTTGQVLASSNGVGHGTGQGIWESIPAALISGGAQVGSAAITAEALNKGCGRNCGGGSAGQAIAISGATAASQTAVRVGAERIRFE